MIFIGNFRKLFLLGKFDYFVCSKLTDNTLKLYAHQTIADLRNGDTLALRKIFDEYHEKLYAYVFNQTQSAYIAEETVQLCFIKIWQYRQKLNLELSAGTQVFRIARTTMIDLLRKENTVRKSRDTFFRNTEKEADLHQQLDENELRTKLSALLSTMPGMQKKVFEMSRFEGKTYQAIAFELSISIKTVETHLSRALKFLRQKLPLYFLIFLLHK